MAISNFTRRELSIELAKHFTPAMPIKSIEKLVGRDELFKKAQDALNSAGRHLFVHGDRGVGKTSLAQTAAYSVHSSSSDPILMGCNEQLTFLQFMSDVVNRSLETVDSKKVSEVEVKLNLGPISTRFKQAVEKNINIEVKSVNAAVRLLHFVAELHDNKAIIVVDEFDKMPVSERGLFSDLIKQISDQQIGLKFIFCGVASTLDEFVGFHESAGRYVFTVHLERLPFDARKEIVQKAYGKLSVEISESFLTRIAQISDGFPYFVHLIGEQIILETYIRISSQSHLSEVAPEIQVQDSDFDNGIKASVAASEAFLQAKYESAIRDGDSSHYELVLWAAADSPTLSRRISEIYDSSYLSLCDQFKKQPHRIERIRHRLGILKNSDSAILRSPRRGWYEFSENMMRGYVRMRALSAGAVLTPDHHIGNRRKAM